MNLFSATKAVSNIIVSMGTGAVVTNAIKATTPADIKTYQKVSIAVGGLVLSSMVGEMATQYTSSKFDETVESAKQAKEEVKKNQDKTK